MKTSSALAARTSFGPTSGVVTGVLGLLVVLAVLVLGLLEARGVVAVRLALGAGLAGVLIWCFLLRPRVVFEPEEVVLRNPLSDTRIPYASVDEVAVRTVTRVWVGQDSHVAIGVGHPPRRLLRNQLQVRRRILRRSEDLSEPGLDVLPDFVGSHLEERAARARQAGDTPGEVRRRPAVIEVAALAVLLVGLALAVALG